MDAVTIIIVAVIVIFVLTIVAKSILVIPQAQSAVIERLGRFTKVAEPGLNFLAPFVDRVRARIDLREQVVSFPPQPVITQDNLTVSIDTVVYFQVTDSRAAVYEISNYIVGVEQLATTTLRNLVGGMSLEETLTSRDEINNQLRGVLDEATGRWGIRVARVELKAIDPPPSIQDSMEKQMRADREKRAMILTAEGQREAAIKTAEGQKQSQILSAEGAKQAAILAAEAERQSRILRAQGERAARYLQAQGQAKAIEKVFTAIKAGKPTPEVLAYQYLQTLPQMAQGDANKVWMIPTDFGKALEGFAKMLGAPGDDGVFRYEPPKEDIPVSKPEQDDEEIKDWFDTAPDPHVAEAVRAAEAVARKEVPSPLQVRPATPGARQSLEPAQPPGPGVDLADSPELSDDPRTP
ncbi:SPFH domain-containing protein [Kibdelosporangium phytohabitans]|uniref:SPFH domain-containing protein n=1 Tax=Kibdelosporangium phytohabitans TaxID=860235 RepID=UPI0009FA57B8|nr:SPFH domain-containing protein [Kibdelosporangium phytohabitans]MBE1461183.1 regulator of protease activity HflC (stomatin/prohibitin superfamily) [Kibdelosporangium phytohabitans]